MLCSHTSRFIYLKTVKTAGTSVEILFERFCCPSGLYSEQHTTDELITTDGIIGFRGSNPAGAAFYNHMSATSARDLLGDEVWRNYFKFCAVRNPFDKVVSMFWFMLSDAERYSLAIAQFEVVRQRFLEFASIPVNFPIDKHIFMIDGAVAVDAFVRFENLHEDIDKVCQKLKLALPIGKLGSYKSGLRKRREHFSEYYDKPSATLVGDAYSWEIDHFKYELIR
jgi:hypothetical protein